MGQGQLSMRQRRGATSHHFGFAAEAQVARHYLAAGLEIVARRWRSAGGEIDLIARSAKSVVFIEVKSGSSLEAAAARLSPRQISRLMAAGEAFLGSMVGGALSEARFDLALVGRAGQLDIIENALIAG